MRKQVYQKRRARLRSLLIFCTAAAILLALLLRTDRLNPSGTLRSLRKKRGPNNSPAGLMARQAFPMVLQQEQFQYSELCGADLDQLLEM